MDGEQAGHAFHHHVARFGLGFGNECDACAFIGRGDAAHPFGAGARLAGAAAAEDEPCGPGLAVVGAFRRLLATQREEAEVTEQAAKFIPRNVSQHSPLSFDAQHQPIL